MNTVLTIIPSLYGGGAEKVAADISFKLSEKYNHKMLLYNIEGDKYNYSADLTELNISNKRSLLGKIARQINIFRKILDFKKINKPRITISHMLMANMLNVLTKKKDKTICILHGEWSVKTGNSKILDKFVKRQYAKADMIISVSQYIKNMFDNYYKLSIPHKVVYAGVDIQQINKKANEIISIDLPKNYLVYVAGFRPVKNHQQLIKQLESYLKKTDTHLVLVGDGELRLEIEEIVKKLGLSEKIHLLGNLTNPYPIIKMATLSLLVSSTESFSLVVVESMVVGTPVIATDCGGPREIIDPEWSNKRITPYETAYGVLIDKPKQWNKKSLILQVDKLLNDNNFRDRLSKNGKERAKEFSLSKTVKDLEFVINNLINK